MDFTQSTEPMESLYAKRLHKIVALALQDGPASKRFKSIGFLIETWEKHDTKGHPVDDYMEKLLQEPSPVEKPASDSPIVENRTHLECTSPASASTASSSMSGPAMTPPTNELRLSVQLDQIAKNRLAALAKREQKAKEKAERTGEQPVADLQVLS